MLGRMTVRGPLKEYLGTLGGHLEIMLDNSGGIFESKRPIYINCRLGSFVRRKPR